MRPARFVKAVVIALPPFTGLAAQEPPDELRLILPADIRWQPAPPSLEPGAEGAVLFGNPGEPGPFTLRVRLPANYRIAPHSHSVSERLTVISGTLCFAASRGDLARSDSSCIGPGSFRVMPAGLVHSDWTTEPVEYQIDAMGPFDLVYVNPQDDPRRRGQGNR